MVTELRPTGISTVGDLPWGTHFCLFYETKADLLDILVPYFKAGLEGNEFCLWIISEPVTEEGARSALWQAVPELDHYLATGMIEIIPHSEWYLKGGVFELGRVINGWHEKLDQALSNGYTGMRLSGNTSWLRQKDWRDFQEYEKQVSVALANERMIGLCSFPMAASGAAEILDVAHRHQVAVAMRVLLADDHELVRAGFRALLGKLRYQVVAEASDGNEAIQLIELHKPDVVLMDIAMPGLNGLEATARVTQQFPTVRVIILSMHASAEYARQALRVGAVGYLLKNSREAELDMAIQAAAQGETYLSPAVAKFIAADYIRRRRGGPRSLERLTPRQFEILQLIAEGYTRKQAAEKLTISVKTFDTYRAQLMEQLGIHDTAGLVRYAVQMGLVILDA